MNYQSLNKMASKILLYSLTIKVTIPFEKKAEIS